MATTLARSCAARLRELEAIVGGPRARLAARFAAALHADDAGELSALSEDFERMGDRLAAIDAAAHAAIAYRGRELRGSALGCSTRAQTLAEQCGGATTPALRAAAEPLPLTDREREIVMLLGEGLSAREVAERLILSVRTVEGHIYRAMTKTGTSTREELTALVHPSRPPSRPSRRASEADCPRLAGPVLYRRPQPRRHRRSLAGAACRSPPVRSPRPGALGPMTSHYCRDPDGNLIEVASYSARD
jgi:DNA-binding CsgD family transcriptional regulator